MNENEITFIISVKNQENYQQCLSYLSRLRVPEGMEANVVSVLQEDDLGTAYNQGMKESNAKYKVYLDENTWILNSNFIDDIINIFNVNVIIGMIGIAGTEIIPTHAICPKAKNRYGIITDRDKNQDMAWEQPAALYKRVEALDDWLLVTQYDVPWRENFFHKNGLYALSQSIEFKRAGYMVAVPYQEKPWCSGISNFEEADIDRDIFLDEYSVDIFPLVSILIPTCNRPHFLPIALESAIKQTYRNIEILIGDNSQDDLTKEIVKKYLEKYKNIFYVKNINDTDSAYKNYHGLLRGSKGDYINYLMDDDIFHIEKITKMMNYFLEYPNISLVTSHRDVIDVNGRVSPGFFQPLSESDVVEDGKLVAKHLIHKMVNFVGEPTTVLLKKKDIDFAFGTYAGRSFMYMGDLAQWIQSLKYGNFVWIRETLSYFRMHSQQGQRDSFSQLCMYTENFILLKYAKKEYFATEAEYLQTLKNVYCLFEQLNEKVDLQNKAKCEASFYYNSKIFNDYNEIIRRVQKFLRERNLI